MPILLFLLTISFVMCVSTLIEGKGDNSPFWMKLVMAIGGGFFLASAMVLAAQVGVANPL